MYQMEGLDAQLFRVASIARTEWHQFLRECNLDPHFAKFSQDMLAVLSLRSGGDLCICLYSNSLPIFSVHIFPIHYSPIIVPFWGAVTVINKSSINTNRKKRFIVLWYSQMSRFRQPYLLQGWRHSLNIKSNFNDYKQQKQGFFYPFICFLVYCLHCKRYIIESIKNISLHILSWIKCTR